jgi:hypothetical protein
MLIISTVKLLLPVEGEERVKGKEQLLNLGFYADNIRYGGFMGAAKVFSFPPSPCFTLSMNSVWEKSRVE